MIAKLEHGQFDTVTDAEFQSLLRSCQRLPPASEDYRIHDYVENVLLTVLDFQMYATAVSRAICFYREHAKDAIRTHQDLAELLSRHPDTQEGNTQVAQYLWGYKYWGRIGLLRRFLAYLEANGVTTQESLKVWAHQTRFEDFQGKVRGIGFAIYKWLVMRQGVETIKPDLWVHRFVHQAIGRPVTDKVAVSVLERAARDLRVKAYELDWRIWEFQRSHPD